jgi:HK97 family phage prohead protease
MKTLTEEFGSRLVTLNNGKPGLRAGIHVTVKDVDGDEPMMDFIGSDDSVDRYNEVIDQSGWLLDNFRANPVIPDCHNYGSVACILGKAVSCQVNDSGQLTNRVKFCLDNPLGALCYKMAKGGFVNSQSVGFLPIEWQNGNGKDEPDRTYTKQELLEISMVVVPANPGATIGNALKSGAIVKADVRAVVDLLKQFCSEEKTEPKAPVSASGLGVPDAELLRIGKSLEAFLPRL